MQRILLVSAFAAVAAASQAAIITQWNFNSNPPDGSTGTGSLLPSIGAGSAALIGTTTATFASGVGSTDLAATDNSGWNTSTYPAQGTNSGVNGTQYTVSTVGYGGISFVFDMRHSNTSSKWVEVLYSVNGGGFTSAGTFSAPQGDTWNNGRTVNLLGAGGATSVAVKVVSIFAPGTGGYVASTTGSSYATSGTMRYDMVTFNGTAVPEPATLAAIAVGCGALLRRRRASR